MPIDGRCRWLKVRHAISHGVLEHSEWQRVFKTPGFHSPLPACYQQSLILIETDKYFCQRTVIMDQLLECFDNIFQRKNMRI